MKSHIDLNGIYNKLKKDTSFFINLQSNLQDISEFKYESVFSYIENSIDINYSNLYEILLLIVSIFHSRPKQKQNIMNLLTLMKDHIQKFFTSDELIKIFSSCRRLLVYLYENDFININSIENEFLLYDDRFLLFYPEIRNQDENKFKKSMIIIWLSKFVNSIEKVMTIEEFKEKRRIGHDHSVVSQIIRDDDIEKLQKYISNTNFDINSKIPPSVFESDSFLNQSPSLIEYSAFFGSINIFKFLLLQLGKTDYFNNEKNIIKLYEYSITGGCSEIIHLVEGINSILNIIDKKCMKLSIAYHQNKINEYIHDKSNIPYTLDDILLCIENSNYEMFLTIFQDDSFANIIEKGLKDPASIEIQNLLLFSLQVGNLTFLQFFLNNFKFDINMILNISFMICIYLYVSFFMIEMVFFIQLFLLFIITCGC